MKNPIDVQESAACNEGLCCWIAEDEERLHSVSRAPELPIRLSARGLADDRAAMDQMKVELPSVEQVKNGCRQLA